MCWAFLVDVSPSEAGLGQARRCLARQGLARCGEVRAADGSTEGFGLPCCSLGSSQGAAWRGKPRHGLVR